MGLDTTHDCWHGAYSAFSRFRLSIARVMGFDLNKMEGVCPDGIPWSLLRPDPLWVLLSHSDSEGDIEVEHLLPLADRLDQLMPEFEKFDAGNAPAGHLASLGIAGAAKRFADGCRRAAESGEKVEFH
jgi:hypothetical protein